VWIEMLMQQWRAESELDGISCGSWYHYLPIGIRDISLIRKGRLYSSVRSSMQHGSETWPVRKENEVALQRADMRMVRWMCDVKVKDKVPSKQLRERQTRNRGYNLWYYSKTDYDGMDMCCEKETLTG